MQCDGVHIAAGAKVLGDVRIGDGARIGANAVVLTDVPAGDYELKVWQEKLGEKTQKITVTAGGSAKADFELAAK